MNTQAPGMISRVPLYVAAALAVAASAFVTITVQPVFSMLLPPALTLLPLAVEDRIRRKATAMAFAGMCVFMVLGLLSVGAFFAPSALALGVALFVPRR
jgi:zinc transporter ZupT